MATDFVKHKKDFVAGSFRADEISVIKSELHPAGAIYTSLRNIELSD